MPQTEERVSSGGHGFSQSSSLEETHWEDHPMVRELSCRGLTSAASKRKLQATVKREVEKSLAAASAGLQVIQK